MTNAALVARMAALATVERVECLERDLQAARKALRRILRAWDQEPAMMGGGPDMRDLGNAIRASRKALP